MPEAQNVGMLSYAGRVVLPDRGGIWRYGNLLIASNGGTLPDRCVKCNLPADGGPIRQSYGWHHPALYLTMFLFLIPYLIIAFILNESGTLNVSLCRRHRRLRFSLMAAGWFGAFIGLLTFVKGFDFINNPRPPAWGPLIVVFGLLLLIVAVGSANFAARILAPKRIDKQYLWLRGAGDEFLASLPDLSTAHEVETSPTSPAQFSQ